MPFGTGLVDPILQSGGMRRKRQSDISRELINGLIGEPAINA